MFSGEIDKIMLECKNNGLDSEEVLQLMEVPHEWTGDSFLFDFGSISVEELSDYIDYIFRKRGYVLEEGTPIDGFYGKSSYYSYYDTNYYRYKIEIYSSRGKTYLEIFMPSENSYEEFSSFDIRDVEEYLEKLRDPKFTELEQIVYQISFLKPSIKGYLICNKCGSYYEVHEEESPDGYPDECECGGIFKYIASPRQPDKKLAERKKTASPIEYLRAPAAMIIVSVSSFLWGSHSSNIVNYTMFGFGFGIVFGLIRYRSFELILDMIYRRLIYFSAAIIFFMGSVVLITTLIEINNYSTIMMEFFIVAVIAVIYCLCMIFKTISPDDPRNFLDPPL